MPLRQHVGSGETMHRDGIRFGDTPRPGMGLTSSDPSVPQKPLACQSAKFGINVQSLGQSCWLYPRSTPVSARAYATGLGDSLRNVQPVLSTSGVQPSLRYARRTV